MSETMDVSFDILDTTSRLVTKDIYKLNIQAFLLTNCPHWAKYAAVDYDGIASWFSTKPILGPDSRWQLPKGALGNYTPIEHAGDYMRFDAEDYEHSIVEKKACFDFSRSVTEKQRLRYVLNQKVFSLVCCNRSVRWAAVDCDGRAFYFINKPRMSDGHWFGNGLAGSRTEIKTDMLFACSNWQNSLIKREKDCIDLDVLESVESETFVLNEKVFDLPMCPSWARYAVVTRSGECVLTAKKPNITSGTNWEFAGRAVLLTGFLFDREHYRTGCVARSRKPKVRKDNA